MGPCLKAARLRAELTQEQLAVAAGLASATIRNVESGRTTPSQRTLERLRLVIDWDHPTADGSETSCTCRPPNGGGASDAAAAA